MRIGLGLACGLVAVGLAGCGDDGGGGSTSGFTTLPTMTTTTVDAPTTSDADTAGDETTEAGTGGASLSGSETTEDGSTGAPETTTTATTDPPDPACGDGVLDPGEDCDAGPDNADDAACTSQCAAAACGDGLVQAGVEGCDEGASNADDAACTSQCVPATCGDGLVQAGVEACDDGNADDADACVAGCVTAKCGDGFVGPGEACDDGNADDDDACTNLCALDGCGDGIKQMSEACDDGNAIDTDACLSTCLAAKCGDGLVHAGVEACDDGNADESDSCTAQCKAPTCQDTAKNGQETDIDCGGPDCAKCGLGDACVDTDDCGQGVCDAGVCATPRSCKQIKQLAPASADGEYLVDPDGNGPVAPLMVHCEMDTDTCGYTWVKFDDPALQNAQDPYAARCAAAGMEVIVTRTKPHAQALYDWLGGHAANLVNVFPKFNGAQGIQNWQGVCQNQPCSFWMTDAPDGDVGCANFEPNGDNNVLYRIYRRQDGCGLQGNWNDANNLVNITGYVICSPNDC